MDDGEEMSNYDGAAMILQNLEADLIEETDTREASRYSSVDRAKDEKFKTINRGKRE